jgi:hypothetical protein
MDELKYSLNLGIDYLLRNNIYRYEYNYKTYLIKLTKYVIVEEGIQKCLVLINIYMYRNNVINVHYTERRQYMLDQFNNFIEF